MKWVKLSENRPKKCHADDNNQIVIRYRQNGRFVIELCDIFDVLGYLAFGPSIYSYEWLDEACGESFEDNSSTKEPLKHVRTEIPLAVRLSPDPEPEPRRYIPTSEAPWETIKGAVFHHDEW